MDMELNIMFGFPIERGGVRWLFKGVTIMVITFGYFLAKRRNSRISDDCFELSTKAG